MNILFYFSAAVLRSDQNVDRVVFTADAVQFTRQRNSR